MSATAPIYTGVSKKRICNRRITKEKKTLQATCPKTYKYIYNATNFVDLFFLI